MMRVVVALSGGVDSSVAAAMLKERGYDVVGVTLLLFEDESSCCGFSGVHHARLAAAKLKIPHYVVDGRELFRERVIEPFCRDFAYGRTPNPCIYCNEHVKFPRIVKVADSLGASFIATGHYARIREKNGKKLIGRGLKLDQSYFLYRIPQELPERLLLPMGALDKDEVRARARSLGLPTAERLPTRGVCFADDYTKLVTEYFPEASKSGDILFQNRIVGRHRGIAHYTIGKRCGVHNGERMYVVEIDKKTNTITIAPRQRCVYYGCLLRRAVWWKRPEGSLTVQVRYKQTSTGCHLSIESRTTKVYFDAPVFGVASGQHAVVYEDDLVVGGGVIEKAISNKEIENAGSSTLSTTM